MGILAQRPSVGHGLLDRGPVYNILPVVVVAYKVFLFFCKPAIAVVGLCACIGAPISVATVFAVAVVVWIMSLPLASLPSHIIGDVLALEGANLGANLMIMSISALGPSVVEIVNNVGPFGLRFDPVIVVACNNCPSPLVIGVAGPGVDTGIGAPISIVVIIAVFLVDLVFGKVSCVFPLTRLSFHLSRDKAWVSRAKLGADTCILADSALVPSVFQALEEAGNFDTISSLICSAIIFLGKIAVAPIPAHWIVNISASIRHIRTDCATIKIGRWRLKVPAVRFIRWIELSGDEGCNDGASNVRFHSKREIYFDY